MHKNLTIKQHVNIFLPSIANLKCTPSDRQMYPRGTCTPDWEPLFYCVG